MKIPADALAPRSAAFTEEWHARTLGCAHALVENGQITGEAWASALGAALAAASENGDPDTEETYYLAALSALEKIAPMTQSDLNDRKSAWTKAYLTTRHGDPVILPPSA